MTSQPLPNGTYTIGKDPSIVATLRSEKPGTDVVLLPTSEDEAPGQRVRSISYFYSWIRSYEAPFPSPVGDPEKTKWKLYNNQPGKLSVVRRATWAWQAHSRLSKSSASRVEPLQGCQAPCLSVSDFCGLSRTCWPEHVWLWYFLVS